MCTISQKKIGIPRYIFLKNYAKHSCNLISQNMIADWRISTKLFIKWIPLITPKYNFIRFKRIKSNYLHNQSANFHTTDMPYNKEWNVIHDFNFTNSNLDTKLAFAYTQGVALNTGKWCFDP